MSVVFVLGGTCFQGRGLVQKLLDEDSTQIVVIINRGRTYWGQANPWNSDRVFFEKGDRETEGFTTQFNEIIIKHTKGKQLKAVVDFSCFHPRHAMAILNTLIDESYKSNYLYILISSDSVYDVCDTRTSKGLLSENFADSHSRPKSARRRVSLHRQNRYGGNKLRIEDILRTATPLCFNFLALRLPDVIGPCDDTGRFWATYLLAKYNSSLLHMRKSTANTKVSFVFSEDVQKFIIYNIATYHSSSRSAKIEKKLNKNPSTPDWESSSSESWSSSESVSCESKEANELFPLPKEEPKSLPNDPLVYRTSVNICCTETPTMAEFVEKIAALIHNDARQVSTGRRIVTSTADFFPSVDCGPISHDAATKYFSFTPTSLDSVLQKTVSFFNSQTTRQLKLSKDEQLDEFRHAVKKLDSGTRDLIVDK